MKEPSAHSIFNKKLACSVPSPFSVLCVKMIQLCRMRYGARIVVFNANTGKHKCKSRLHFALKLLKLTFERSRSQCHKQISEQGSYANLKFVYDIGSRSANDIHLQFLFGHAFFWGGGYRLFLSKFTTDPKWHERLRIFCSSTMGLNAFEITAAEWPSSLFHAALNAMLQVSDRQHQKLKQID